MINVKRRRGFAVSVDGKTSDSSVNQGGKITSNLYVRINTFKLFVVRVFSVEGAIFQRNI